ncbi:nitroreductase family protein [Agromyces endophyticus]|uniref:nitroreductase family protein n=1 Tax=Agromyces sp. H17E-10 TaxID=2932244 RepID=UPI001FD2D8ED|nr:nitroreductase family protein [Agromyces sp. H17E-10]UOQ89811.1 nitroreductase family protein [Agromyces sp. H17E-10]
MLNRVKRLVYALLAVPWIRKAYEFANTVVLETFGSSRILTHILYFFAFLTFNREQSAVLRGRRDYYRNKRSSTRRTRVELRRNVHRLEKALLMRPRRAVFATDYIGETIEFYTKAHAQCSLDDAGIDPGEISWAHDVLATYFNSISEPNPTIDAARAAFAGLSLPTTGERRPYSRVTSPDSEVSYDDLLTLAHRRRSVRWFEQRPVPRELIDQAFMVARQAPTACNRMPYEFRVFDDPELVRTVSAIPFGAAGYAENIPTIIVVIGKLDSYFSPRDRHAIYVDAALASMSFMFALETLGLSSSVINWPDFEPLESRMQKTLKLGMPDRVVMLIAVGYADPDGVVAYSQKKELDTFRSYNVAG